MKKDVYLYYGLTIPEPVDLSTLEHEQVEKSDSSYAILQSVYALDPVTKLPTGDIMCYLSSTTPPELKQYIMDNLMVDTSSAQLPSLPDGIDDDTAFALQRQPKESSDQYRLRVNNYMQDQVKLRNMAIDNAKRQQEVVKSE